MFRKRSRVVPVFFSRKFGEDTAGFLHFIYYQHREVFITSMLERYPEEHPVVKQYSVYMGSKIKRFFSWVIVDVLIYGAFALKRNYNYVKKETGKGILRQFSELVWLSLVLPSMPENYYKFSWYLPERRVDARKYIHRYETKTVLYSLMLSSVYRIEDSKLKNKYDWFVHASTSGIPSIPILTKIDDKEIVYSESDYSGFIGHDLFIKPVSGKGGRGTDRWEYNPAIESAERYISYRTGKRADIPGILTYYSTLSRQSGDEYIVQPAIRVHPHLEQYAGKTAVTVRMITILNEENKPELVGCHFRMPAKKDEVVDNTHAGGYACVVDIDSGKLGKIMNFGISGTNMISSNHPVTGIKVEGTDLPYWEETKKLVYKAHESIKPIPLIGWDVCITVSGPVIVEANRMPCTDGPQRRTGLPLSEQRFGKLIEYHIKKNRAITTLPATTR
jgi:hypothetical protein